MGIVAVIRGTGLVSVLGDTAGSTWDALLAGRCITNHAKVGLEFPGNLPRVSHLAIRAAREAVAGSGKLPSDTALVVGTSKGPVTAWLGPPATLSDPKRPITLGLAQVAADLAEALRLTGPRLTVSAACASGLHALIRGVMLIQSRQASWVVVVAAEASVHPLFIESFRRLGVLPPGDVGCRPFDELRRGFLMSEAAAAVLLQSKDRADDAQAGIRVERFALGADATHLTGTDSRAAGLRYLLDRVIDRQPIDLIHAHGTGTQMNDPVELAAIESALGAGEAPPNLYSHKAALGHSLGAAGLVSVVINCFSHQTGIVPPNVGTSAPLASGSVTISRATARRPIRRSLAIASGFGGPLAVVALNSSSLT